MKKKLFSMMLAASTLTMGITSCSNDENAVNDESAAVKSEPTSMKFTVTMPRSLRTYAPTDTYATDAELALNSVNVLVYAKGTDGIYTLEKNGNKSLTASDFTLVAGDTYELTDPSKLSTVTGTKRIMVAMNYPGTLPTAAGAPLSDLDALIYTLSTPTALTNSGIAMFSVEPKEVDLVADATSNTMTISVKRMVAKFTVQEKIVRQGGKIMTGGGELTNMQYAVGNINKTIYPKQQFTGTAPSIFVKDTNWSSYVAGTSFFGLDYALASTDFKSVDVEATSMADFKTIYVPENTSETTAVDGENVTYISVRAQYAPAFFANADGSSKGPNTAAPKTFWTVVTNAGAILYFDVEADADAYKALAASNIKSAPYTDGFCYWRVYVNQAADTDSSIAGSKSNKYDVLRNGYYKSTIKSIKALGTPEDKADIKTETSIDIDTDVNPWEPTEEEFDL